MESDEKRHRFGREIVVDGNITGAGDHWIPPGLTQNSINISKEVYVDGQLTKSTRSTHIYIYIN